MLPDIQYLFEDRSMHPQPVRAASDISRTTHRAENIGGMLGGYFCRAELGQIHYGWPDDTRIVGRTLRARQFLNG